MGGNAQNMNMQTAYSFNNSFKGYSMFKADNLNINNIKDICG